MRPTSRSTEYFVHKVPTCLRTYILRGIDFQFWNDYSGWSLGGFGCRSRRICTEVRIEDLCILGILVEPHQPSTIVLCDPSVPCVPSPTPSLSTSACASMERGQCRKQFARPYDLKKQLAVRSACTAGELHRFEGDRITDDQATVPACVSTVG